MELLDGISVLSGTVPSWTGTSERGFEGKEIESELFSGIMGIWKKVLREEVAGFYICIQE